MVKETKDASERIEKLEVRSWMSVNGNDEPWKEACKRGKTGRVAYVLQYKQRTRCTRLFELIGAASHKDEPNSLAYI